MANSENVIVAVSGGPDSMYLLKQVINNTKLTPIVAHVNYNLRQTAERDKLLVEDYCKKNEISFNFLNVKKNDWEKAPPKNKQSKARYIRYEFFQKIAFENNTNIVYVGHHLDDWIETAIMLEDKSDQYLYYGIKSQSSYKNLIIKRPLLNLFKEDIILKNKKENIPFEIDETNNLEDYERNRIRKNLIFLPKKNKRKIIKHFQIINKSKQKLEKKITNLYLDWKDSEFDWKFYSQVKSIEDKRQLIYKLITRSEKHINISFSKLDSIMEFFNSPAEKREFRLMENIFLEIIKGKIYIQEKNEK